MNGIIDSFKHKEKKIRKDHMGGFLSYFSDKKEFYN